MDSQFIIKFWLATVEELNCVSLKQKQDIHSISPLEPIRNIINESIIDIIETQSLLSAQIEAISRLVLNYNLAHSELVNEFMQEKAVAMLLEIANEIGDSSEGETLN